MLTHFCLPPGPQFPNPQNGPSARDLWVSSDSSFLPQICSVPRSRKGGGWDRGLSPSSSRHLGPPSWPPPLTWLVLWFSLPHVSSPCACSAFGRSDPYFIDGKVEARRVCLSGIACSAASPTAPVPYSCLPFLGSSVAWGGAGGSAFRIPRSILHGTCPLWSVFERRGCALGLYLLSLLHSFFPFSLLYF